MTQGQSKTTPWKESGFQKILEINLSVVRECAQRSRRHMTYFHFDINSGCGINANSDGSPLGFMRAYTNTVGDDHPFVSCRAYFVDNNQSRVDELAGRLHESHALRATSCVCANNRDFCAKIPSIISSVRETPTWAMGSILVDPNGMLDAPFRELHDVLQACPRLDVIMSFHGTSSKRIQGAINKGTLARNDRYFTIDDIVTKLPKKFWHIREPENQWTVVVGRNHQVGSSRSSGFVKLDSSRGREIQAYLATIGAKLSPAPAIGTANPRYNHNQLALFGT